MIDRSGAEAVVAGKALGLTPGQVLWIASYKRDRWVEIRKQGENYRVTQHGFDQAEHDATRKNLRKLLKHLFKREFPRSNKLHLRLT